MASPDHSCPARIEHASPRARSPCLADGGRLAFSLPSKHEPCERCKRALYTTGRRPPILPAAGAAACAGLGRGATGVKMSWRTDYAAIVEQVLRPGTQICKEALCGSSASAGPGAASSASTSSAVIAPGAFVTRPMIAEASASRARRSRAATASKRSIRRRNAVQATHRGERSFDYGRGPSIISDPAPFARAGAVYGATVPLHIAPGGCKLDHRHAAFGRCRLGCIGGRQSERA